MEKKKVVTIRLNGKETPYKLFGKRIEDRDVYNEMRSMTTEEMAVSHENDENDIHFTNNGENKHKNVVDFSKRREEKINRSLPYWDDGNRARGPKLPPFGRRKIYSSYFTTNFIFNSLILSIIAAVVLGTTFGIILLKMITRDDTSSVENNNQITANQLEENTVPVTNTDESYHPIPTVQFFVIQEGAYSTMDKALEGASILQNENIPNEIFEGSEFTYVFMGVSATSELGEGLARFFQDKGKEPYMKEYVISQQKIKVNDMWNEFIQKGTRWMELAAILSAKKIAAQSIEQSEIEELVLAQNEWEASYERLQMEGNYPDLLQTSEKWINTLDMLDQSVQDSEITEKYALELQQSVLHAMLQYEQFVNAFENVSQ